MNIFTYDNTLDGLYSCIFYSYKHKIKPDAITTDYSQIGFCDQVFNVKTDKEQATRVKNAIYKYGNDATLKRISDCLRSGKEDKSKIVFDYACSVIDKKQDCFDDYSDDVSRNFIYALDKVYTETHRFKGFIRFQQTIDGIFYAHYEPENDVTELILPHFKSRYGKTPFVIHDVKRNILGLWNGYQSKIVNGNGILTVSFSEEQQYFEQLWKTYYNSVNIEERKNHRQMQNFMPKKYWKHLPEKS